MAEKKIICDTDVMIDYLNKNNSRHSTTKNILENIIGLSNVVLSAITKIEIVVGAKHKNELITINKDLDKFNIILIDHAITHSTITLLNDYNLSHGLQLADAFIAATSKVSGLDLFAYNIKDYKFIKGLDLFVPET